MSALYFKVLSDYYHHIVGDLSDSRKHFLKEFHEFILEKDEYGYETDLSGELGRIEYLLKKISEENLGMDISEYITLRNWYDEDGWSYDEINEYFLYFKKNREIMIVFDFISSTEKEKEYLKQLNNFLENKARVLKIFNPHNGKYVNFNDYIKNIFK